MTAITPDDIAPTVPLPECDSTDGSQTGMSHPGLPRHLVIDNFLSEDFVADLLEHALTNQDTFEPTTVMRDGQHLVDLKFRNSLRCKLGLGPLKEAYKAQILLRCDEITEAIGLPAFDIARTETELVAHHDNAFFGSHIDTFTQASLSQSDSIRIVSCVYYFHLQPKRFSGGEVAVYPFFKPGTKSGEVPEPLLIEPRNNRLVTFPSFVRHEVLKVRCPGQNFADSRFAVNCWLHRAKSSPPHETGA